ncbi:hypothetical protein DRW41_14675 [Neobacillus piezotolerans]|uniref:Glycosyltransferase RgtA/B/C/D-like domain-containing protein n=1 Tax=Neobacillus piezotolerans TaxID=2259171 RepID=A0A3D8GP56_9BACI|nr:hypothetical protein [Neobacillus piezotolerans]RDU36265.1 hypothetical protein DRW41_14675 [Neobacillus piezotolerans]
MGERALQLYSLLAILIAAFALFYYINPYISSFDAADFALAINRFDLLAMQPHFPGYPYFILGGKIISFFTDNPAKALSLFNGLFYVTSLYPVYRMFKSLGTGNYSILATAALFTSSFLLVSVNQPMSEGAALASLWWFLWSLQTAFLKPAKKTIIPTLFWLGILLGIRLSYIPFVLGPGLLLLREWRSRGLKAGALIRYAAIAFLFQLIWVAGLIATEGSIKGFFTLALSFTGGHFEEWGGTAASSSAPIWERLYTLAAGNMFWTGMSAHSIFLACLFGILAIIGLYQITISKRLPDRFAIILIWLFSAYFLWALFAQNIEKARHALPLSGMAIIILMAVLLKEKPGKVVTILCTLLVAAQAYTGIKLLRMQSAEPPAVYQVAEYVGSMGEKVMVYTHEESRVFDYLRVPFSHKKIFTYDVFLYDSGLYEDYTILLTGKVAEGFMEQGVDIHGKIEEAGEFHSNPLFEPIYNDITLYRWKKN